MSQQQSFAPDERTKTRAFKRPGKKPHQVWYRTKRRGGLFGDGWWKFGAYKTPEIADQVMRVKSKCKYFEYERRDV